MKLVASFVLLSLSVFAADPLPAVRSPAGRGSWNGLVGVPGGIPAVTTIYTNFTSAATAAQIQSALDNCPSNQVVKLGAGTFNLGGAGITITSPGVVLRGSGSTGAGKTTLTNIHGDGLVIGDYRDWYTIGYTGTVQGAHTNWNAGYSAGTTNITIANGGSYSVGQIIVLDQESGTNDSNFGNAQGGVQAAYEYTSVTFTNDGRDRFQKQQNRIYAKSGNDITLYEPLYFAFDSSKDPEVFRFTATPVERTGIEDLEVYGRAQIHFAWGCWASNVVTHLGTVERLGSFHLIWVVRCTVTDCFSDASATGIDTYGIQTRSSSGVLVQNNILNSVGSGLVPNGSVGSVWAYNVMTNNVSGSGVMTMGLLLHGGNPMMNLFEGNYVPCIGFDNTWGSSSYNVAHRNRAVGWSTAGEATGNQQAFIAGATNRFQASIGNVLGTTDKNTWYEDYTDQAGGCHDNPGRAYALGFWDTGCQVNGSERDTWVRATLLLAYNWTSATATNSGIVPDGYTSSDIPSSYYLTSKPDWFGALTYPPVSPASPTYSASWTNIPSGHRFTYGSNAPAAAAGTSGATANVGTIRIGP